MDSLSWDNGVGAEGYVVSDTLIKSIDVLTLGFTECLPVCHLKNRPVVLLKPLPTTS